MTSISKSQFYHLQLEERLTSNLGLKNVGSLTFFYIRGFCNIFFFQKKKDLTENRFQKSLLTKKIFLLNVNLKNVVKQKRCTRVILLGAEKKIKIEGIHIEKKNLNHPKKRGFIFRSVFYLQSLPTTNFSLV